MSSHATLSAAADDRKARLAKLKSLKRKQPTEADADDGDRAAALPQDDTTAAAVTSDHTSALTPPTKDVARMHLSGRNYDFETKGPKLGFEAPPTLALEQPTLEQQAQDLEEESRRQAAIDAQNEKGIDLFNLQPKKPNWDLKRELNARMEVLNVRTDNAIARLVRERLAEKKAAASDAAGGGKKQPAERDSGGQQQQQQGDAEAEGMLDGAALVEGMRMREREEEENNRREREAEAEEFGMA
ncbi:cwf18 pre-mRNA splicing factor-domain-containing protein [Corynascus novoguineensis]|uniref:Cwf18 pre-mRNA splicing factor-domain-containing protein n=1 Tax=Corynascus novoguineensis TaxID=1126955 RepID=A0AAN7CQ70_9PEZI|nr:cwf18 pre-mRNA splicing factor-domain-containing protein [Corynascus novoguineensis]